MQRIDAPTPQVPCRTCTRAPAAPQTGTARLCMVCALIKLSRDHFLEGANFDTSQRIDGWDGSGVAMQQPSAAPVQFVSAFIGAKVLQLEPLDNTALQSEIQQWRDYQSLKSSVARAQQQPIGATAATVPFVNPTVESGFLYNSQYGVVPADSAPPPQTLSNSELEAQLRSAGVERRMVNPQAKGLLASLLDPFLSQVMPSPIRRLPLSFKPLMLQRGQIERMLALPHGFPVFVRWPMFGAALATHYMLVSRPMQPGTGLPFSSLIDVPSFLHFAVQKYSPYGITQNEPFSLGIWLVPAANALRMDLAIAHMLPAENIAVMDDKYGQRWSVPYTEMLSSKRRDYEIARRALYVQYPSIAGTAFATRLVKEVPAYMAPNSVVIPQVLRDAPASLVEAGPETVVQVQKRMW